LGSQINLTSGITTISSVISITNSLENYFIAAAAAVKSRKIDDFDSKSSNSISVGCTLKCVSIFLSIIAIGKK
jgi:hypothetical protein